MDLRTLCKIEYAKLLDENLGRTLFDINHNSIVFGSISESKRNKSKNKQMGFPGGTTCKEIACQCRRHKRRGFNPWVRKIEGHGNLLQYSCLENSMDRLWGLQSVRHVRATNTQTHGLYSKFCLCRLISVLTPSLVIPFFWYRGQGTPTQGRLMVCF